MLVNDVALWLVRFVWRLRLVFCLVVNAGAGGCRFLRVCVCYCFLFCLVVRFAYWFAWFALLIVL